MKYRMLRVGEVIREGDEFLCMFNKWIPTESVGLKMCAVDVRFYRRPVRERCGHINLHTDYENVSWCIDCGAIRWTKTTAWQRCNRDKDGAK